MGIFLWAFFGLMFFIGLMAFFVYGVVTIIQIVRRLFW